MKTCQCTLWKRNQLCTDLMDFHVLHKCIHIKWTHMHISTCTHIYKHTHVHIYSKEIHKLKTNMYLCFIDQTDVFGRVKHVEIIKPLAEQLQCDGKDQ